MSRQNKVKKLRLALMDDQSHDVIWVLKRSRMRFVVEILFVLLLLTGGIWAFVAYTPARTLIPGYPDANTRHAAIQTALRVDSLQGVVARWELYSTNLLRIVEGQEPIRIDSLIRQAAASDVSEEEMRRLQAQDSLLRAMVVEQEQFELSGKAGRKLSIEGAHFFTPLKGVVSAPFAPVTHPFLEIAAPANSVVMSVLDGTVIYTGWSDQDGYSIVLQHEGDIISVYRHSQKLLARTGDKVLAGATLALAGDTGSLAPGGGFQIELWYRGEAVDPQKYIKF